MILSSVALGQLTLGHEAKVIVDAVTPAAAVPSQLARQTVFLPECFAW